MAEREGSPARSYIWKNYDLKEDMWGVKKGYMDPKVTVISDEMIIWEKVITPYFSTPLKFSNDLYIPKPFYQKRLERAQRKAQRIADRENKRKEV